MRLKWLPLMAIIPLIISCARTSPWRPYYFNGNDFQPDVPGTSQTLWLRNGYMPRLDSPSKIAVDIGKLPPNTGVAAGICYLLKSGGIPGAKPTATLYPDEQIIIKSKQDGLSVTRTDGAGFFIEILLPGDYEFFCRGTGTPVTVIKGETTLVKLRSGK